MRAYVFVCVCVCERERERAWTDRHIQINRFFKTETKICFQKLCGVSFTRSKMKRMKKGSFSIVR